MSLLLVVAIVVVVAVVCIVLRSVVFLCLQVGLTNYGPVFITTYFAYKSVMGISASAGIVVAALAFLVVHEYWGRLMARVVYVKVTREKLHRRFLDISDQRGGRLAGRPVMVNRL